jgi:REP element-mobilizing transposase RayT
LIEPAVAEAVINIFEKGSQDGRYELGTWVLMPNHVYLVLRPTRTTRNYRLDQSLQRERRQSHPEPCRQTILGARLFRPLDPK